MDHVVYLDSSSKELEKLQRGVKTHLIRGAAGPKVPHGKVAVGDMLYFTYDNGAGAVKYKASVKSVFNSEKMDKDASVALVESYSDSLRLSATQLRRVAGKKFIVIVEIENLEKIDTLIIEEAGYGHELSWWIVEDIHNVLML